MPHATIDPDRTPEASSFADIGYDWRIVRRGKHYVAGLASEAKAYSNAITTGYLIATQNHERKIIFAKRSREWMK